MAKRKRRRKRDIEKDYPRRQFIAKLRRLADCLEDEERFRIQVAGERISIPPSATPLRPTRVRARTLTSAQPSA